MPPKQKNDHLPFQKDGVQDYNKLFPDIMHNLLHDFPGIAYRCKMDAKWTMLFISQNCPQLTGYVPEELLYNSTLSFEDLIYDEDRSYVRNTINRAVKNDKGFQLIYRIKHKDGSIRWVWEQGRAIYYDEDNPLYLDGFIQDVTRNRELEDQLAESAHSLKKLNQMKDRFFTAIVRDLQDPVYSFISLSSFLQENLDKLSRDELLECVVQMSKSASGMDLILENLLNWAKANTGRIIMQKSRFDLKSLIDECSKDFDAQIQLKQLQIRNEVDEQYRINTDRQLFSTIIRNLISNAIKYSKSEQSIIISASLQDELIIVVEDNGVGIPRTELKTLFDMDRNYRTHGTLNEAGTGIGLLLVKELMNAIKGSVEVESRLNRGTKITLRLNKKMLE